MTIPGSLQLVQNAPAVVGGALSRPKPPSRAGSTTRYGLTMWFKVVVDGDGSGQSLGLWSSCSGLGVNFNPEQLKEGGNYDGALWLPGEISYGQIVLERAMDRVGSAQVRSWLARVAAGWINADEAGAGPPGPVIGAHRAATQLVITLYSNLKQTTCEQIASWTLRNAIPVAWAGPTLSAKGSEVAVEKLTIAHRGFLNPTAQPAPAAQPDQGKLTISHGDDKLKFQYNPVKVGLEKTVTVQNANVLATTIDQQVTDPGKLSIKLNDLRLEGATAVHDKIEKLFEWLAPNPPEPPPAGAPPADKPADTDGDKGKGNTPHHKKLLVRMGAGPLPGRIEHTAILKAVSVTYLRFSSTSVPNRASVNLTLEGVADPPAEQSPTPGGPPGGQVHTVTAGENVQGIATAATGDPSGWRQIAEANNIDDPLRVRNGQSVWLPARRR